MKRESVLVTGANGLLGTNTVIELLNQNYFVRGFMRDKKKYIGPKHPNLELFQGDILNTSDLKKATLNCQYVINCAAVTDQSKISYNMYHSVNVQGVKNILITAVQNKVKRIIQIGTANEFGYGELNDLGNETKNMKPPYNKSLYARSKKEAYHFLKAKTDDIDIVFVNPTFMIGSYDSKPSSGRIILMGLKKKLVFCPPGGKSFVCVKDVARGVVSALKCGDNKASYLMAHENLSFLEFLKIMRNQTKGRFRIILIPKWVLISLGCFGSLLRFFRIKTNLSIENMKSLSINSFYSNRKSCEQLYINYTPIKEGIKDCVKWFEVQT